MKKFLFANEVSCKNYNTLKHAILSGLFVFARHLKVFIGRSTYIYKYVQVIVQSYY